MHPGYQFVGDNVDFIVKVRLHPGYQFVGNNDDFIVKVRHMSLKHQNKDHHLFQWVSYKNRLAGYHLEDNKLTLVNVYVD